MHTTCVNKHKKSTLRGFKSTINYLILDHHITEGTIIVVLIVECSGSCLKAFKSEVINTDYPTKWPCDGVFLRIFHDISIICIHMLCQWKTFQWSRIYVMLPGASWRVCVLVFVVIYMWGISWFFYIYMCPQATLIEGVIIILSDTSIYEWLSPALYFFHAGWGSSSRVHLAYFFFLAWLRGR